MKQVQHYVAVLCVLLLAAPAGFAQDNKTTPRLETDRPHWYSGFTMRYEPKAVPGVNLNSSNRIDSITRAGNIYLSLQDAIALALENNIDLEVTRYQYPLLDTALYKARIGGNNGATGPVIPSLDPVLTGTINFVHNTTPQQNTVTTGTTALVTTNKIANFGVQQGFLTGGLATLSYNNTTSTQNAFRNSFNPSTTSALDLQITQPLLNGFGLALNNRGIKLAKNNIRGADFSLQSTAITTISNVVTQYWNLVSAVENVRVQQQALDLAQKLLDDNQKQVEIGTLAPLEVVRARSQVAQSNLSLIIAQSAVRTQENTLKTLLSRTGLNNPAFSDAHVIPTDRITIPDSEPVQPVQDLYSHAIQSRPELSTARLQIENAQTNLTGTRNAMLPQLNLIGDVRNNALAGSINTTPDPTTGIVPRSTADGFFVGGYGDVLRQLFGRNFPTYSLGVNLNIPLKNRSAQADMQTAQYNLRVQELSLKKQENQVRTDIQNALVQVQQARESYQAATQARILQEQTLDAEQKKFTLGTSTPYFVVQAQRDLATAQQAEVTARTSYALAKNTLDTAAGMTLERYNVQLDETKQGKISRPASRIPDVAPNGAAGGAVNIR